MRKFLAGALMVASFGGGAVLMAGAAGADPTCTPGGHGAGPVSVNGSLNGTGGFAQVCTSGTGAADGTVTAAGDAQSQSGYIVADGNSSNPGALGGYIGVSSTDNGVVGCSSGDYNNESSAGNSGVASSGDNDATDSNGNDVEDSSDSDANNQIAPLPTDPNFQGDLQNDLAAAQAQTGPCAVGAPA